MPVATHKSLVASLTAEQRSFLTTRSNRKGTSALLVHFGLIGLFSVLLALQVSGWQLLILPQGVLLVFLFTLLHEVTHRTVFTSKRTNDLVAAVCGWLLMLPPNWFRYFHFAHHRFTQNPEKDPELQSPKPGTVWSYLWYLCGLPVAWGNIKTVLVNATGECTDSYVPNNGLTRVCIESRIMFIAYVLICCAAIVPPGCIKTNQKSTIVYAGSEKERL